MHNEHKIWNRIHQICGDLKRKWVILSAAAVLVLAAMGASSTWAAPANQTVPIPTPTDISTPLPTSTPTFTPEPPTPTPEPTDTPVPEPTDTPLPGTTPEPTATSTATRTPTPSPIATGVPTATPIPSFAMQLEMRAPTTALQGRVIEIEFVVTNPSQEVARNVRIRDRLAPNLILIGAEATDGDALLQSEDDTTVVLFQWDSLAPGAEANAVITAIIAPEVPNGTIVDNLAVAFADNAAGTTAGISIGLPPAILPLFN